MKHAFFLAASTYVFSFILPSFAGNWAEVPGATPETKNSPIFGVEVLSDTDVWAVGSVARQPLIEHWDGAVWTVIRTPHLEFGGLLQAVAARSSNDVWAVGSRNELGQVHTLIEHWNGSRWLVVPSPSIGTYDLLYGVEVVSRNDAWAVGSSDAVVDTYILMHWDGTSWSLVDGPPVSKSLLRSVKAFSSNDVWAVGSKEIDNNANTSSTLTLHWDGTTWSEIPSPNVAMANLLTGVDGIAPNDVWAVGTRGLAMHWDGTAWTVVPTPHDNVGFFAIKVLAATDVWAVGDFSFNQPLSEHWDGTQWRVIPTPPIQPAAYLFSISGRDGAVWAAGYQNHSSPKLDELFMVLTP